jgi:hypothetical protein
MIIIHTKKSEELFVNQWVKEKGISLPIIIFNRDEKNIFNEDNKHLRRKEK